MITPTYVRTMAAYNAEMNRRVYAAAGRLSEAERRADRGVFWGSLHGTLSHLLWADAIWLSRFAGWPRPAQTIKESDRLADDFAALGTERQRTDAAIEAWATEVDDAWLDGELTWLSGSTGREMRNPRRMLVTHFFNHQTHHRGQAHALLTRAGEDTGDTDLWLVVPA